jgi:hypothetical protein
MSSFDGMARLQFCSMHVLPDLYPDPDSHTGVSASLVVAQSHPHTCHLRHTGRARSACDEQCVQPNSSADVLADNGAIIKPVTLANREVSASRACPTSRNFTQSWHGQASANKPICLQPVSSADRVADITAEPRVPPYSHNLQETATDKERDQTSYYRTCTAHSH